VLERTRDFRGIDAAFFGLVLSGPLALLLAWGGFLPWVLVVAYQESSAPSASTPLGVRIKNATKKLGAGRFQPNSNNLDNASDFASAWSGQKQGFEFLDVTVYASSGQGDDSKLDTTQSSALLPTVNAITKALGVGDVPQIPAPISLTDATFNEAPFIIFIRPVFPPK